jgi:hypothetical protein
VEKKKEEMPRGNGTTKNGIHIQKEYLGKTKNLLHFFLEILKEMNVK